MYLRRITLKDWKCYAGRVSFEFPAPTERKNVVLIGAENGFGKTSLFQAMVLGLFGRDGMPLLQSARFEIGGDNPLDQSYVDLMGGMLHRPALDKGVTSCSVELEFGSSDGQPITLHRIWHYSPNGAMKRYDEEVRAFVGLERRALGPLSGTGEDRLDWFRDYVARTFVPYYLGWFFLFDGEMVQSFANRDMRAQVRNGIEGLLGLPVLRDLASHLREYAAARGRTGAPAETTLARLEGEAETLAEQVTSLDREIAEVVDEIGKLDSEQQALTRELSSYGAGTQASLQELLQRLEQHRASLRAAHDRLQEAMEGDLALALCGRALREATITRLKQEERREQWEAGRAQGDSRLETFLGSLRDALIDVAPPLVYDQREGVLRHVRGAWDRLWNPPDPDTAPEYRHDHIRGAERVEARVRLERIAAGGARLRQTLDEIAAHEREIDRLQDEVSRTDGLKDDIEPKRARLQEIMKLVGPLNQRRGALEDRRTAAKGQLEQKRKELARVREQLGAAAPGLHRAAMAEKVAATLDAIVKDAVPSQIEAVAEAMTEAYHAMAHKQIVSRVHIGEDCSVRLLTGRGRDLREVDPSAGEKQIFSLALISAVLKVSGRIFPMVVDTPLGRLDQAHRLALLRQLTEQSRQVILLSTDTEVVGAALDEIRQRVSCSYVLRHRHEGDIGFTRAEQGYFKGQRL